MRQRLLDKTSSETPLKRALITLVMLPTRTRPGHMHEGEEGYHILLAPDSHVLALYLGLLNSSPQHVCNCHAQLGAGVSMQI